MPKPTDERSPSEPTKRMAEILGAEWVERSLGEGLRAFLLASWDRIYGDCIGWTAFKAAVDEGRYDDALDSLTRPAADDALLTRLYQLRRRALSYASDKPAVNLLLADLGEGIEAAIATLSTNAEKR